MKRLFLVVFSCQLGFGQAVYSGQGADSGPAIYGGSGNSCAAPNFCAYTGVDMIPTPAAPNLGGVVNNYATVQDTSFLGYTNADGTTFNNSANLSPITRVSDTQSTNHNTYVYTAGSGGSGMDPALTNPDTSLISLIGSSTHLVCRFITSGTNKGQCAANSLSGTTPWYYNGSSPYPAAGSPNIFITEAQNSAGNCSSNCSLTDFGSFAFDKNDRRLLYTFGNNVGVSALLAVTPVAIDPASGEYTVGATLVDFQYGLPLGAANAPNWSTSTPYSYGQYVTHALTTAEMANGGVWASGYAYNVGDVINNGNASYCMYRVLTGGTSSGSIPAFITTGPCKTDTITDAGGVKWQGTNSTAQFVYQETNPACTAGSPCTSAPSAFQWLATPNRSLCTTGSMTALSATLSCGSSVFSASQVGQTISITGVAAAGATLTTTITAYTSGTTVTVAVPASVTVNGTSTVALLGHPDMLSGAVDANGLFWTNIGPSYLPVQSNSMWLNKAGISSDQVYSFSIGGTSYSAPSKYAIALSTNSYGMQPSWASGPKFANYNTGQGSGVWIVGYDFTTNTYQLFNTLTGIWSQRSCTGGTGYNCSGGAWSWSVVGTFKAITDPLGTGQFCPDMIHNYILSRNGQYGIFTSNVGTPYEACDNSTSRLEYYTVWSMNPATFDQYASLQFSYGGFNHFAMGTNKMAAFNSGKWGAPAGVFLGIYSLNNVQGYNPPPSYPGTEPSSVLAGFPSPFSIYMVPFANQGMSQTVPPGCYVTSGSTIKNPDCNLGEVFDSHLSWGGDNGTDTYPVCGTTYNYATLGPAFNTRQNMETCYQTSPTYPTGYAPGPSWTGLLPLATGTLYGKVWQFTHTFATGTSVTFSTQFQISEYSQDANWMFWSSDWDCTLGSTLPGNAAPAVWSSGTYYQQLIITAVPPNPNSLCGMPWAANTAYAAGNLINPIEATSGAGGVNDDVLQALTAGTSGPESTLASDQPKCGSTSCWTQTNSPTINPATVTAASEAGTTGTITVSGTGLALNNGVLVTLAGFSPSGWNGTFAFSGTSGTGLTTFTLAGMSSGLGAVTTMGTATAQGDTVCDFTSGSGDFLNPASPYSSSCASGVVWQDLGPQTQRGDVFAVNLGNQH